jgi:polysaccharide export outer membrane protein
MNRKRLVAIQLTMGASFLIINLLTIGNQTSVLAWSGQERPIPPASISGTGVETPAGISTGGDYRIGPGDVIEIRVDKAEELSGLYHVNSRGTFQMYFLGSIAAQNKSPEELSLLIADGLRGRYLKSPRVTVEVKQYNSRAVFVQGAVRIPGVYQLGGGVSLLKLISICGGLTDNHGSSAFIFRETRSNNEGGELGPKQATPIRSSSNGDKPSEPPEYVFTPVSIAGLYNGNLSENIMIEPHDIINIPVADVFFVAGEVRAPGSFQLKPGTTLRQAISLAQGTTIQAASSRAMIFREDSKGQRIDLKVDVAAIMSGKSKDVPIQANDVIIIPNSKLKSVGAALLRSLGMSTYQVIPRY